MTDLTELRNQIATLFLTRLHLDVPSPDTDLIETHLLDSLGLVDLLLCLEQELGIDINIDDIEIDNFRSITRIAEYIAARQCAVETS